MFLGKSRLCSCNHMKISDTFFVFQADALFSPRTRFDDLEVLPGRYKCDINGVGMMVKKDSDLPSWWNPAFKQYYLSGKYNDACDQINQKYGGMSPIQFTLSLASAGQGHHIFG